jgi:hypothetical protein
MTPDRWQQIDALLDLALEQEPSQRAAFLVEACAGDEVLRQEVETLLVAYEQAGSFLGFAGFRVFRQGSNGSGRTPSGTRYWPVPGPFRAGQGWDGGTVFSSG